MSGFRHFRFSDVRSIHLCPVFRRYIYIKRLKTGHKRPVIGHNRLRELEFKLPDVRNPDVYVRLSDVIYIYI